MREPEAAVRELGAFSIYGIPVREQEAAVRELEAFSIYGISVREFGGGCEGIGGVLYICYPYEGIWRRLGGNKRLLV